MVLQACFGEIFIRTRSRKIESVFLLNSALSRAATVVFAIYVAQKIKNRLFTGGFLHNAGKFPHLLFAYSVAPYKQL
jgi:predicted membrane-bound mannosyltransferase